MAILLSYSFVFFVYPPGWSHVAASQTPQMISQRGVSFVFPLVTQNLRDIRTHHTDEYPGNFSSVLKIGTDAFWKQFDRHGHYDSHVGVSVCVCMG